MNTKQTDFVIETIIKDEDENISNVLITDNDDNNIILPSFLFPDKIVEGMYIHITISEDATKTKKSLEEITKLLNALQ